MQKLLAENMDGGPPRRAMGAVILGRFRIGANDALAPEVALARCKAKGGGKTTGAKCVLYALDERIVYSGK